MARFSCAHPSPHRSLFRRRVAKGPYKMKNFAVHAVILLDLAQQLQLLPAECTSRDEYGALRDLLLPFTSDVTLEYAVGTEIDEDTPELEWWEDVFLPAAGGAFSCGFSRADGQEDPRALPSDIREDFENSKIVQQVWRLVKSYIRSPQKQRENNFRQQDFDVSLYIPFLKVPKARSYLLGS